ncbi:MAG: UDP-4-amino-4,6-dideoxy-N-acetyl-beta-L-altrosamine N-acetyltransferase [Gammaproteobacteria bacterium]|nr:UDP-4-amino-4,6-dideoxy-N-acetyl-beta-L-altrosamine N-acetyltransferase [Gammaproteobacteria bacterium]
MEGYLRALRTDDLEIIREWRNHLEIKKFMFSQQEIDKDEHIEWFEASKYSALRTLYLYEEAGQPIGFLQIQKLSEEGGVYEWGFYIDPFAVRGAGTRMAQQALKKIFTELAGVKVIGEVLAFNKSSRHLHQKLGFVLEGVLREQHLLKGQYYDIHCFGMLKKEWEASLPTVL